jgi:hypothetical protein
MIMYKRERKQGNKRDRYYSSKTLGQQDECGNRFQELGVVEERAEVNSAEDACLVRRGLEWGT